MCVVYQVQVCVRIIQSNKLPGQLYIAQVTNIAVDWYQHAEYRIVAAPPSFPLQTRSSNHVIAYF